MGITVAQEVWGRGAGCHLPEACYSAIAPHSSTSPRCFAAEETTAVRQLPPRCFQNSRVAVTTVYKSLPPPLWERTQPELLPMGLEQCLLAAFLLLLGECPAS